jgi:hypothetical protein
VGESQRGEVAAFAQVEAREDLAAAEVARFAGAGLPDFVLQELRSRRINPLIEDEMAGNDTPRRYWPMRWPESS